jgi:hypothetical protein
VVGLKTQRGSGTGSATGTSKLFALETAALYCQLDVTHERRAPCATAKFRGGMDAGGGSYGGAYPGYPGGGYGGYGGSVSDYLGMESEAWEPPESSLNRLSWVINEAVAGEVSGILLNLDLLTVEYLSQISVPAMRKTGGGTDPRSAGRDGDRAARSRAGDGGGSSGRQARDAHADYAAPAAGTKC